MTIDSFDDVAPANPDELKTTLLASVTTKAAGIPVETVVTGTVGKYGFEIVYENGSYLYTIIELLENGKLLVISITYLAGAKALMTLRFGFAFSFGGGASAGGPLSSEYRF